MLEHNKGKFEIPPMNIMSECILQAAPLFFAEQSFYLLVGLSDPQVLIPCMREQDGQSWN